MQSRVRETVASTAHLTAAMRALGRVADGDAANTDCLADRFLLPSQRWMLRASRLTRFMLERVMPGGYGYFNARTQYFDDQLSQHAAAGIDQLVLLGAGYDCRPVRFARALDGASVFEVDMPQVLQKRAAVLRGAGPSTVAVPIDFEHERLTDVLLARGFTPGSKRTLFLWEGVTYYFPYAAVQDVVALDSAGRVGRCLVDPSL